MNTNENQQNGNLEQRFATFRRATLEDILKNTDKGKLASVNTRFATPEENAGFLLWQVTNSWQRMQREGLEKVGLTHAQYALLGCTAWLTRHSDMVTQVQLARFANTDVMMTSQVLRTLEQKGFIKRSQHPTDSRAKIVELTDLGFEAFKAGLEIAEQTDDTFFKKLGEKEAGLKEALRELMYSNQRY